MAKLVLIDGNAIIHRAYHAMPALTTPEGKPINAVYGLVSMLLKIIQDLDPTHIAVCFDRKEPTFRHEEYEKYQAHRPEVDADLVGQFELARRAVSAFNIPIFEKAGYEADDLIGTISQRAKKNKSFDDVVIVTGDRDILQLVGDNVKVYMPIRGLSEAKLMDERAVKEKMGVEPAQIIDLKAFMGDASDNYPGVFGIGPKTAVKLLDEYKSFENVYMNLDKIPENIKDKLEKDRKNAEISYKLAKIVTDIDENIDFNKMKAWTLKSDKIEKTFSSFGFRTLTRRVKKMSEEIDAQKQGSLF